MSAPAPNDLALLDLLDAGGLSPTSCDGTAYDMLTAAALGYARSRGWVSPERAAELDLEAEGNARSELERCHLAAAVRKAADGLDACDGHPNPWLVLDVARRLRRALK